MNRFILALVCMFFVSGCAQPYMIDPGRQPELKPEADKATLVILRDQSYVEVVYIRHYIDGKFIGSTNGHSYIVSSIASGPHYVVVDEGHSAVAHINFEPGKTYYLGLNAIYSGFTKGIRTSGYIPLISQKASDSIKRCMYLEYNPIIKKIEDMVPSAYKNAVDAYLADVKANPDGYKAMLDYKGY